MTKLSRDEQLYQLVKPVIDDFRFEDSKPGEDIESILRSKIRYDSLRQRVSWVDENLLTKKDRIRELISAKEESALYDLEYLDIEIAKNSTLNRRLADIGLSRIHDKKEKRRLGKLWTKGQLSTGTLFFDDFLTEERTNRTVKRKDGKTYQRSGTKEAILNDRLRQLSDAVYPDIEDTVNNLREVYVDVTGMEAKNYKIPGTTYLRESVVLRTKIGKALVKKEDLASDFRNADPHYQYRFLADKWLQQKDNSNFVLKDFLQKQLRLVTGDRAVLESYKEVAQKLKQEGKIVADIKISDKLSVHDQIQQYRKALSGNVQDIADIMPKTSPAYLDLVTSQKDNNPELYKKTVQELSDSKTSSLPRQIVEDINKYRSEEKQRLFSSSVTQQEFNQAWKEKKWLRGSVDYQELKDKTGATITRPDGKPVMIPVGVTKFNGAYYRSDVESDIIGKLNQDFDRFKEREQRIMEGPAKVTLSTMPNSFGNLLQQQTGGVNMVPIDQVAQLDSKEFSSAYSNLSDQQKKIYDYNYGKPVEAGDMFYRSVYDIPDKVWAAQEKATGFKIPRQRGGTAAVPDINVTKEEELQKKITEDLKNRSWEPVVKEKPVTVSAPKEEPLPVVENRVLQQETKSNLEKMLQASKRATNMGKIGSMGAMAAFVLFNAAMAGPSDEALAHKRKVEEERRMKMYGY